jgi:hypothetical protein
VAALRATGAKVAICRSRAVNGSAITFGSVGSAAVTSTGTVSGDAISGTYQVGGTTGGNWSASKSS